MPTAYIVKTLTTPLGWSIEWIDADGGVEQAMFHGPDAEARAEAYAAWKYGGAERFSPRRGEAAS